MSKLTVHINSLRVKYFRQEISFRFRYLKRPTLKYVLASTGQITLKLYIGVMRGVSIPLQVFP